MQGIVVTGACYWVQLWVVEKKGPLFAVTFTPLALIFTAIFSAFLWKEILYLGRYVYIYIYIFFQLLLLYNFILFFLQLINNKYILGSLCGGVLLVGGLYCVIWGKNREAENKEKAAHTTTATTHHIAIANIPIAKAEVQTITSVV